MSETPAGPPRRRPRIGFQAYGLNREQPVWLGAAQAARQRNANLICFAGGAMRKNIPPITGTDAIYDLLGPESVDGVFMWAGQGVAVTHYLEPDELADFLGRFAGLPSVNYEGWIEGIPSVLTDTYPGMRTIMAHLIEVHGYRRIALVRGPVEHFETGVRVRAYTETLAEYGLPYDDQLMSPPAETFEIAQGQALMRYLLDERGLRPGLDFQAVAATDVEFARGALLALQARGIRVPHDVAVVSFNDYLEDRAFTPPLTTVRKPFYEVGQVAVEFVLDLLEGRQVPEKVDVPTQLVVRQSCGCLSPAVAQVVSGPAGPTVEAGVPFEADRAAQEKRMLLEMQQAAGTSTAGITSEWASRLLEAFVADVNAAAPGRFLLVLDDLLRQVIATGSDGGMWHQVLSTLRHGTLPDLVAHPERLARAHDLWAQAQIMIGENAERVQLQQRLQFEQQTATLRRIQEALTLAPDIASLIAVLVERLPQLGIPSCYLALYEPEEPMTGDLEPRTGDLEPGTGSPPAPGARPPVPAYLPPVPEWARLVMAYDENGSIALEPGGRRFRSRQLLPEGVLPETRCYTLVAHALSIQRKQLGFVLYELGPEDGWIYHALRGQISSALQAVLLTEQVRDRARQLQASAEVARAVSSILDINDLLSSLVETIRSAFRLYYVAVFMLDAESRYAVLREATGEAGQELKQRGQRLEVGGQSMVGTAIAQQSARIALDVDTEAVRFANPLLPDTRSEIALPLRIGRQVLGALDVQSTQLKAFSPEDVTVLQIMSDQMAIAIRNAQLFEAARRAQQQAQEANRLKTQFLANMSHELRTPLNSIINFTRFVMEGLKGPVNEAQRDYLGRVHEAARHLLGVINDVLDLSKVEAGRLDLYLEEIDLGEIIRGVMSTAVGLTRDKGLELRTEVAPDLPHVRGDRTRLRQVVLNLVSNAAKFTERGHIAVRAWREDGEVRVSVEDSGSGMRPEDVPQAFEEFRQVGASAAQRAGGTGLGLPISRRLVELHGGKLWAQSAAGQGSTFTFSLPLSVPAAELADGRPE